MSTRRFFLIQGIISRRRPPTFSIASSDVMRLRLSRVGAPAVAVVFFVLASIGGLVLLGHVLVTDRKDRAQRRRSV